MDYTVHFVIAWLVITRYSERILTEIFREKVFAGFVVKIVISSGIGMLNARMNGWKKTNESVG